MVTIDIQATYTAETEAEMAYLQAIDFGIDGATKQVDMQAKTVTFTAQIVTEVEPAQ